MRSSVRKHESKRLRLGTPVTIAKLVRTLALVPAVQPLSLIVPAAGWVRNAAGLVGEVSPVFRLGRGKVFLDLLLNEFNEISEEFDEIILGLRVEDVAHANYLSSRTKISNLRFVGIEKSSSPCETIQLLLENCRPGNKICLQLGDTLVDLPMSDIKQHPQGIVVDLDDSSILNYDCVYLSASDNTASSEPTEDFSIPAAHVGFYWFSRPVDASVSKYERVIDFVFQSSSNQPVFTCEAINWLDSDHSDRFNSRQDPTFESRSFNTVKVLPAIGSVVKESTDLEKLEREYEYVKALPYEAQYLFPSVRDFKIEGKIARLSMDYWPFPNMSDLYCFSRLSEGFWDSAFQSLATGMKTLHTAKYELQTDSELLWSLIEKTKKRLGTLSSLKKWDIDINAPIQLNGNVVPAPAELVTRATVALEESFDRVTIVHGDLCFSNILIDPESLLIKFIDPRGGFRNPGLQGPRLYDLGKLSHSIHGGYDSILKGFYTLNRRNSSVAGGEWHLKIRHPHHRLSVIDSFRRHICDSPSEEKLARLAGGLILMSIPPLHLEDLDRARAFFLNGALEVWKSLHDYKLGEGSAAQ